MATTIYLKDGRVADLVTKTEKGYLVDPYCTFKYYEDNEESAPSGVIELAQEIFTEAPKELIEFECQKIHDRMAIISAEKDRLQQEKNILTQEVNILKKQKTDLTKLIFNRSDIKNAKRIVVFPKNEIAPMIYDQENRHKLALSIEVTDYDPKIRAWTYKFYGDDRYGSGDYFDEDYGVHCDLSDDEVMALNLKRLSERKFDNYIICRTADKWLTPDLIQRKQTLQNNEKIRERSNKEKQLQEIQEWLSKNEQL